jgi:hypothetical protein
LRSPARSSATAVRAAWTPAGEKGALYTFSAKLHCGYAVGLLSPAILADLNTVRSIRNAFAHATAPIDFDTPAVKGLCEHLNASHGVIVPTGTPARRFFTCTLLWGMYFAHIGRQDEHRLTGIYDWL